MRHRCYDIHDVELELNKFLNLLTKFLKLLMLLIFNFFFIFNSYCIPNYGLELWDISKVSQKQVFKYFKIYFSKALKRICGLLFYTSNHWVANSLGQFLFKHHVARTRLGL